MLFKEFSISQQLADFTVSDDTYFFTSIGS